MQDCLYAPRNLGPYSQDEAAKGTVDSELDSLSAAWRRVCASIFPVGEVGLSGLPLLTSGIGWLADIKPNACFLSLTSSVSLMWCSLALVKSKSTDSEQPIGKLLPI